MGTRRAKTRSGKFVGRNDKDHLHQKKQKRNLLIMGTVLIFLMISSVFGVMFYSPDAAGVVDDTSFDIEGYSFELTEIDGVNFYEVSATPSENEDFFGMMFYVNPQELIYGYPNEHEIFTLLQEASTLTTSINLSLLQEAGINLSDTSLGLTESQTAAIRLLQYQEAARASFSEVIGVYGIGVNSSYATIYDGISLNAVTCEDATAQNPVLLYSYQPDANVDSFEKVGDYCLIMIGTNEVSFLKMSERLKFLFMTVE